MNKKSLLSLLLLGLFSCFEEPTLPAAPSIQFNSIEFIEGDGGEIPEMLVLHIDFKDGDGDLGLSSDHNDPPFQQANYFKDNNGKLLTRRSINDPNYSWLPPYEMPFNCMNYTDPAQTLYFTADLVDDSFNIVDTIEIDGVVHYGVQDYIYFENNEDHYNIDVDFLVKEANNTFVEYDWRKLWCNQSFDGRFPPLGDGEKIVEGKLAYEMKSIGFLQIFTIKALKLRVTIKDRALNHSNTIETPEFTLGDI